MATTSKSTKKSPTTATVPDQPNVLTVGDVRRSSDREFEDLQMVLSTGHRVTFPHLGTMEVGKAEDIGITLQRGRTYVALGKWLSKDDLAAVRAEGFTLLEMARLARLIGAHFADAFAELGVELPGLEGGDLAE